jgi:hypothetical protein
MKESVPCGWWRSWQILFSQAKLKRGAGLSMSFIRNRLLN